MNFDIVAAAQALSQPVSKLIEVVAAGCGRIYEPTGIRRRAHAEAEARLIEAANHQDITDIALRAQARRQYTEERQQSNVDSIVGQAAQQLIGLESVTADPVDPDWASRFFSECQDIGDQEVQSIWSKILAGEVKHPGSFSVRTLSVLKNLSKQEAELFNTLCKHSFRSTDGESVYPFCTNLARPFWDSKGLKFLRIMELSSAGLLTNNALSLDYGPTNNVIFRGSSESLYFSSSTPQKIDIGRVSLTLAGNEISKICEWDTSERMNDVAALKVEGMRLAVVKNVERQDDGLTSFDFVRAIG